jgi:hypothetical protein
MVLPTDELDGTQRIAVYPVVSSQNRIRTNQTLMFSVAVASQAGAIRPHAFGLRRIPEAICDGGLK